MNASSNGAQNGRSFYVTGGTLRPDAPCYIERKADKELCEGLLNGEFCYVLTSRQMGKSSLMVRTVKQLRQDKAAVAVLDLTAIGQNLTIEQWYDGLVSRLGQQLDLEDELLDFWNAHPGWGPLQRWLTAIEEVVLKKIASRVVIFVDEIDIVRSLPFSTDEFFAAIRETYNRRSRDPAFGRLAFGLLGVASPTDLIRDTRMTPFNIGRRIELHDFTAEEAAPLARGLGPGAQRALLERVLHWTGGHPYLTQRLCRALAEEMHEPQPPVIQPGLAIPPVIPTIRAVDRMAERLFLSRQAREQDDNLVFVRERILRSEADVAGLLYLYRRIRMGHPVPDDETNQLVTILRLSGIARGVDGLLEVRNRIYAHVFDSDWIRTNMPEAEVRRQKAARRRGALIGFGAAIVLLLAYTVVAPLVSRYTGVWLAHRNTAKLEATYRAIQSYRDTFETSAEIGIGGSTVTVNGTGSLIFEKPNRINLAIKNGLTTPETEVRMLSDGAQTTIYAPALKQHKTLGSAGGPPFCSLPPEVSRHLGPLRVMPVYRIFVAELAEGLKFNPLHMRFEGTEELNGQRVQVIQWDYPSDVVLGGLGISTARPGKERVPITLWVSSATHLVVQMRLDLSAWASELVETSSGMPVTSLVLTERHRTIETSPDLFIPAKLEIPADSRLVSQLELPKADLKTLTSPKWEQVTRRIPARMSFCPSNLIDLTQYYNASKGEAWHPGPTNNHLGMLPTGLLQLDGTPFDFRGVVQLAGRELERAGVHYPREITGISMSQKCRVLHFLHATGWPATDGRQVGRFVVHYADGSQQVIPVVYGVDVRDWNVRSDFASTVARSTVVWRGENADKTNIRLFKSTWVNPMPETEIVSLDYSSTMEAAAPFLLAITAEP